MISRLPPGEGARQRSGVLDAIFEVVEEREDQSRGVASPLFRTKALEHIDVPKQLDNLLPLTTLRSWIALVGVALLIIAGLVYAGGVVQTSAVDAVGRVVAAPGIAVAATPRSAVIIKVLVTEGDVVAAGDTVAIGYDSAGDSVMILSPINGLVWQQLGSVGQVVMMGDSVTTILPTGSAESVLLAIPEDQIEGVAQGALANITDETNITDGIVATTGRVTRVGPAPIPGLLAVSRLSVALAPQTPVIMVEISLETPLTAGSKLGVQIIKSQRTLLQQLMNM